MQRVYRSRRRLAGLLRRSPLLDSAATNPGGSGPHPVDSEFQAILEMADAPVSEDDRAAGYPAGYPRGSSRV